MEFGPIFAAIRRRWWILAVTLVVGILAAVVVNAATPRQYTATARLFVAATGGTSSTESYSGEQFSQQRTASYAHMIVTEQVAQRVVDKLKLPMSAKKLSSKVRQPLCLEPSCWTFQRQIDRPRAPPPSLTRLRIRLSSSPARSRHQSDRMRPVRPSPWSAGPMCPPPLVRRTPAGISSTALSAASASVSPLSACPRRF